MGLLSFALLASLAHAQVGPEDRPLVPGAGVASEGGPGMLWVNPANMAYDPDARFGTYIGRTVDTERTSIATTFGAGGFAFGLRRLDLRDDAALWTIDYGTSVEIAKRIAVGGRAAWHIVPEARNFLAYDVGVAWRPLPWFGLGAVTQNIGSPASIAPARAGLGVAVRPFGQTLTLGGDVVHRFGDDVVDIWRASARVRPVRGVYLRGSADSSGQFVGGVEVFFGGAGFGGAAEVEGDALGYTAFVGTDEPGASVIRAGRKVAVLRLDESPPYEASRSIFDEADTTWLQTLDLLRHAADDPAVRGLTLVFDGAGWSWAAAQEFRTRIVELERAGKPVVAYLYGSSSTADYYIASAASRILVHPGQDLYLTGVSAELMHLGGMFEKLGVEPQFVRRSEYKSAVEQYTNKEPSGASLEQTNALLDTFHGELVRAVSEGREKTTEEVTSWIDGGPWTPAEAIARGIVDGTAYPDEVEDQIEDTHGKLVQIVDLDDLPQPHSGWANTDQIAVIYVEGVIMPGRSGRGGLLSGPSAGSDTIVDALEQARDDARIKAIVLRIDSPGGSSFASDEIHRAIESIRREGKPVVVSMGAVAASGGYYIACNADAIWAEPTTITGSIGVYSGKFAIGALLDRFGVSTTSLTRGKHATIDSGTRAWNEEERARMDALVQHVYDDFKTKVADGRHLTAEQVEAAARGRVWSGQQASTVGLVDKLGDLHQAIADARERAGIADSKKVTVVGVNGRGGTFEALAPARIQAPLLRGAAKAAVNALGIESNPSFGTPVRRLGALLSLAANDEPVWMLAPLGLDAERSASTPR